MAPEWCLLLSALQGRSCLILQARLQLYSSSSPTIQLCIALAATLAPALALMAAACLIAKICSIAQLVRDGAVMLYPEHAQKQ